MENRIGYFHQDGAVQFPALDINGRAYARPATTYALDATRFVVLPTGFDFSELPAKLAALGLGSQESPVSDSSEDEDTE